ncbi:MAG: hypothetical protein DRQ51_02995 [Gammaproteobacteria bacterium]|nr:MAG: hypothetical protein DRQ51_02995 [Gammaproteobacteria bacterium]
MPKIFLKKHQTEYIIKNRATNRKSIVAIMAGKKMKNMLSGDKIKKAYKKFTIAKAKKGTRTLHAPSTELKDLQRTILDKLQKPFRPSIYAHGFVKSTSNKARSIITNASYHKSKKYIIKTDIKNFFPSIKKEQITQMLVNEPFEFTIKTAEKISSLACLDGKKKVLPQGGVLSPYLSNMLCCNLDDKLSGLATKNHCNFTRYADDITFSTNDKKIKFKPLIQQIYKIVESYGFVVNRGKTKVLTPADRQVVTGIITNDGINVNRKYYRNLRAIIHNCEDESLNIFNIDTIAGQIGRFIKYKIQKRNKNNAIELKYSWSFKDSRCSRPNIFSDSVMRSEYILLNKKVGVQDVKLMRDYGGVNLQVPFLKGEFLNQLFGTDKFKNNEKYAMRLYKYNSDIESLSTGRLYLKNKKYAEILLDGKWIGCEKYTEKNPKIYNILENKFKVLQEKHKDNDRFFYKSVIYNKGFEEKEYMLENFALTKINTQQQTIQYENYNKVDKNHTGDYHIAVKKNYAVHSFFKHLLGRFVFYGSVVLSNNQDKNYDRYKRVGAYEKLLYRFYKLVEKHCNKSLQKQTLNLIKKTPKLKDDFNVLKKMTDDYKKQKEKSLEKFHYDSKYATEIDNTESIEALDDIAKKLSKKDVRFFRIDKYHKDEPKDYQNYLMAILKKPAIDLKKTMGVLLSFKGSQDGLGVITHDTEKLNSKQIFETVNKCFTQYYYYLPQGIREEFDNYIDALNNQDGRQSQRFQSQAEKLKKNTRFGNNSDEEFLLKDSVDEAILNAKKEVKKSDIKIHNEIKRASFYTHVPTIKQVFEKIIHSLYKNSKGSEITISCDHKDDEKKYQVIITDNSDANITNNGREFVNGKLSSVMGLTFGLCDYFIETEFNKKRKTINMHNGEFLKTLPTHKKGFTHILQFATKI